MTDTLEYITRLENTIGQMRDTLRNIVIAYDSNDNMALEGLVTEAQELVK